MNGTWCSTAPGRQRYVWARFLVRQFAVTRDGEEEHRRRSAPVASATRGFETATRWR